MALAYQRNIRTPVIIAVPFTMAKIHKESCYPTDRGNDKDMKDIYTTNYHSAIKKNKILPLAARWLETQDIVLNDISHTQTNTTYSYVNMRRVKLVKLNVDQ